MFTLSGQIVAIKEKRIYPGTVVIEGGKISKISHDPSVKEKHFILPGFIDSHIHIESSMLPPSEFARLAVVHGTVATVSDPHEIGNVLGVKGVDYMIENGAQVNFKFFFGAPSCVPATTFETAGGEITSKEIESLLSRDEILYLAEMMNWPGVLHGDSEVMKKIAIAKKYQKPVDGHAPGLRGKEAKRYIEAGISTDHECFTAEEALDKLKEGMKIIIREGSAAKNFEALIPLMHDHSDRMMFCSDDKHPDNLVEGHINLLAKRAVAKGIPLFSVLKAACLNPIEHYGLPVGKLKEGEDADFIVVEDLTNFKVLETYIRGECVFKNGKCALPRVKSQIVNNWNCIPINKKDLKVDAKGDLLHVIEAHDRELITTEFQLPIQKGNIEVDLEKDVLKIVVINRYFPAPPSIGFIKNFGLKRGALASSVAHDSHNLIAVGTNDTLIAEVINELIALQGGIALVDSGKCESLPLPIAGLMSADEGHLVAHQYASLDRKAKEMGSTLTSPFMTLSFMALLVIPSLKLSDKGLFDGKKFELLSLTN